MINNKIKILFYFIKNYFNFLYFIKNYFYYFLLYKLKNTSNNLIFLIG